MYYSLKACLYDRFDEEQPERCGFYTFAADGSCAQSGINRKVQCAI